jgi:hypothetical protein
MWWPEPAATEEPGWNGLDHEPEEEQAEKNRLLALGRRLLWLLITLLVILSLLAPLLAPIFQTRQSRPKTLPDGLQAHLLTPVPAFALASQPF